jgi:endoglucanase
MKKIVIVICLLTAVQACFSQIININGTVTNAAGIPVSKVIVKLQNTDVIDTTDIDGFFSLKNRTTETNNWSNKRLTHNLMPSILNNRLSINAEKQCLLDVTAFSLHGRALFTKRWSVNAGVHSLVLPVNEAGIHVCRVKIDGHQFILKGYSAGKGSLNADNKKQDKESALQADLVTSAAQTEYILTAIKNSYEAAQLTIKNSDTSGIVLKISPVINLPGRIEVEDFKVGGEGVGFHDVTSNNKGSALIVCPVDIDICKDTSGGYNVGWIDIDEWLSYKINVLKTGPYNFTMRMAAGTAGTKTALVTVDGSSIATFDFTDASGDQSWKNVRVPNVNMSAGNHELRIVMKTGNFNLNYLDVTIKENQPPVANAGPDKIVKVNTPITLDGRGSSDPDNGPSILSYSWIQTGGATVTLTNANTAQPSFTPTNVENYRFCLTVSDSIATSTDTVACGEKKWDFYLGDNGDAKKDYTRLLSEGNTKDAELLSRIAFTPTAQWFGDWDDTSTIESKVDNLLDAATTQGRDAVFVVYAIYAKDCNSYSAGGLSPELYLKWVRMAAKGIQGRHPWVILEPDALAMLGSCEMGDRISLLKQAAQILHDAGARVYLDVGNSGWLSIDERIRRIKLVGTQYLDGFSSNVSNDEVLSNERKAGDAIAAATGIHYIIDTGRNGNGSNDEWCNPRGRALGEYPAIVNDGALDAYIWVKGPGWSDGPCNGGPSAGKWFFDLALELCRNAAVNQLK